MAKGIKDRGDWQRLTLQWRVALRVGRNKYASLSKNERERLRLTAFLSALETGATPPWARLSYLAWQNPEADHEPEPLSDHDEILGNVGTLNKGGWLARKIKAKLSQLGGELTLERQPTGGTRKSRPRQGQRKSKNMANVEK